MNEPTTTVSDAELAKLLGVSARRIRQLAEQGVLEREERGKYALGPSIRAVIENAAGSGSELQRERIRKLRADANLAELELAREKGLVAPIQQMERVWNNVMATIRAQMMGVPGRVIVRIIGEKSELAIKAALADEIRLALTAAAEADLPEDEPTEDRTTDDEPE